MKRPLIVVMAALVLMVATAQQASAWGKFSFSAGLNTSIEWGGRNVKKSGYERQSYAPPPWMAHAGGYGAPGGYGNFGGPSEFGAPGGFGGHNGSVAPGAGETAPPALLVPDRGRIAPVPAPAPTPADEPGRMPMATAIQSVGYYGTGYGSSYASSGYGYAGYGYGYASGYGYDYMPFLYWYGN